MSGSNLVTIVMYHYVRPIPTDKKKKIRALDLDLFRRQLEWLSGRYSIISIDNLNEKLNNGTPLPENSCLLTFDDGYKDHYLHVFSELLKRKLTGCFFPCTQPLEEGTVLDVNKIQFIMAMQPDTRHLVARLKGLMSEWGSRECDVDSSVKDFRWYWIRYAIAGRYDTREERFFKQMLQYALPMQLRKSIIDELFQQFVTRDEEDYAADIYMSIDQIHEMIANGMSFGGHGYRHLWLNREPEAVQEEEIDHSIKLLSRLGVSEDDWVMCYPFGAYDERTLKLLQSRKCRFAFTVEPKMAAVKYDSLLELGRFDTNDFPRERYLSD